MSRKGENIFKRNDGRWEGRYIKGRKEDGKAIYGSVYGRTYTDVKERVFSVKASLRIVATEEKKEARFSSVSDSWLNARRKGWKESTLRKYEDELRIYLLPKFGERNLSSITNEEICSFFEGLMTKEGKSLSVGTACIVLSVLKQIRKHAIRSGITVSFDPACVSLGSSRSNGKVQVFTEEEEKTISEYIRENMDLYGLGVLICLFTGIRIGELCALKWENIDLKKRVLHVRTTLYRIRTDGESGKKSAIVITVPKSRASIRSIPLIKEIWECLRENENPGTYVLSGKYDKPVEPAIMRKHFKRLLCDCGVRNLNFHTTRHTFATRCIEMGIDVKTVSELLGHSDVSITLARYVHTSMDHKAKSLSVLSNLFGVNNSGQN